MQQPINMAGLGHGLGGVATGPGQELVAGGNASAQLLGQLGPGRRRCWLLWHLRLLAARIIPAAPAGKQLPWLGCRSTAHAGMVIEQQDELDSAIQRVEQALDRVRAAWQAEHPDRPLPVPEPHPPAWHPDPNQAPVTTRQWAEVTRLRASALCRHGLQVYEQALALHQSTQRLHAFLQRPPMEGDPSSFTRVGPAILLPPPRPHR
jgi:hypothetical protein